VVRDETGDEDLAYTCADATRVKSVGETSGEVLRLEPDGDTAGDLATCDVKLAFEEELVSYMEPTRSSSS
jgi:hypothetical protein